MSLKNNPTKDDKNPTTQNIMDVINEITELKVSLAVIKTDVSWIKKWIAPTIMVAILSLLITILSILGRLK